MIAACDGLDEAACAAVEEVMVDRVVGMDPARVTAIVTRKVATRIATDQVAAATAKNREEPGSGRCLPGPDGSTDWWARLPRRQVRRRLGRR